MDAPSFEATITGRRRSRRRSKRPALLPTNDLESAIFQTLAPGAYTAIVSGSGDLTGVGAGGSLPVALGQAKSKEPAGNSSSSLQARAGGLWFAGSLCAVWLFDHTVNVEQPKNGDGTGSSALAMTR